MSQLKIDTRVCVVGGGPAGMMAGYLLARGGTDVVVLEKHADFLRDFRGDTIHPSTLDVMGELGLLDRLLERPHTKVEFIDGVVGEDRVRIADFRYLAARCKFIALMPQWDFLDFLAREARRLPNFSLKMKFEATGLIVDNGKVRGVRGRSDTGPFEANASLTLAADGRHSILRDAAKLRVRDLGAPMDVLWLRLPKQAGDSSSTFGRIGAGTMFVMIDRGDYWQCALVIRKGSGDQLKSRGLEAFHQSLARASRLPVSRFAVIDDLDKAKLLTVGVDRLERWARPGLVCIGDCAHAMSPVGGVGINLAIQDAVAAANILTPALRMNGVPLFNLEMIQARRAFPTWATQTLQTFIQRRVIAPTLDGMSEPRLPTALKLLNLVPALQQIPARVIGMGFRPEHVGRGLLTTS